MEKNLELVTHTKSSYVCYQNGEGNIWERNGERVLAAYVPYNRYSELKISISEMAKQGANRKFRERLIADEDNQRYRGQDGVVLFLNSAEDEPIRRSSFAKKVYDSQNPGAAEEPIPFQEVEPESK